MTFLNYDNDYDTWFFNMQEEMKKTTSHLVKPKK